MKNIIKNIVRYQFFASNVPQCSPRSLASITVSQNSCDFKTIFHKIIQLANGQFHKIPYNIADNYTVFPFSR